uniref:Exportin-1 n=1 Tax=Rhizochromulina marina TaxID=1034831 RepID=A0A7S2SV89_9STRA|mmetsp:Transcript_91/g.298  ORF Transcript_91/g.298 Transcript_91/m.298 type:complete len:1103 (+) Transcript_91:131-3439(+)
MGSIEEARALLLDFSQPFDVALFEKVVEAAYQAANPDQPPASRLLVELQEHPDMWTRADAILEQCSSPSARFFGALVLTDAIKTKWKAMSPEHRDGIKNYVVQKIIALSSDEATMQAEKVFLHKLNMALVCILQHEWPHNWPDFISEIYSASASNEVLCENNMHILQLLSEEVFEVKDQITSTKAKALKESLNKEFAQIFDLCFKVLQGSERPSLLNGTLVTLQRFLTWIPLGYIFETPLILLLVEKFFPVPMFRHATIECLTEIASLKDEQYDTVFVQMYIQFLNQVTQVIQPDTTTIAALYDHSDSDEKFVKLLALFLSNFFKAHLPLLETSEHQRALDHGLLYLICISELEDNEIFKICLDYWRDFSSELYTAATQFRTGQRPPLALGGGGGVAAPGQREPYRPEALLHRIRTVMICKMAKPEEVLVVEDENGDIVREAQRDTEVIAQYKTMRETLVFLTHLNYDDTDSIMLDKLSAQVDGSAWSPHSLNTLCWAIGSISGAMSEEEEKRFLVIVIKDLLHLCENKRGKDNKAVIASNIMYVVGQYPRFLRAHWKFLRTVVNKLFEFMHELHPGVRDMACDTFLKIAQKCKRKFVTRQNNEQPYFYELTEKVPVHTRELEPHQIYTFYEASACMLSDRLPPSAAEEPLDRTQCLLALLAQPNAAWTAIMTAAGASIDSLWQHDTVRELQKILKINQRICSAVGGLYYSQLGNTFVDMMNIYKTYSDQMFNFVAQNGEIGIHHAVFKAMRGVKRDILRLLATFVSRCAEPDAPPADVAENVLPILLEATPNGVLGDYFRSIPQARDADVLALYSTVIAKLPLGDGGSGSAVQHIMEALFQCTLEMIVGNFEDFPDIRLQFFQLLRSINQHSFGSLFSVPPEQQKLVVDSVAWAIRHTERNIAETGLDILYELLQNVERHPQMAQEFYRGFLLELIKEVFHVMTDRLHKNGFKMHSTLLRHMIHVVEMGQVTTPLFDLSAATPGMTNQAFLREHITGLLVSAFPHLTKAQVVLFVSGTKSQDPIHGHQGLFDVNMDLPTFKQLLRDFLVQIKEFAAEDNQDLYYEETQQTREQQLTSEHARRQAVPGILNPYEVPDDMADL